MNKTTNTYSENYSDNTCNWLEMAKQLIGFKILQYLASPCIWVAWYSYFFSVLRILFVSSLFKPDGSEMDSFKKLNFSAFKLFFPLRSIGKQFILRELTSKSTKINRITILNITFLFTCNFLFKNLDVRKLVWFYSIERIFTFF